MIPSDMIPMLSVKLLSENAKNLFNTGQEFEIQNGQFIIGRPLRGEGNAPDLSIKITQISRKHSGIFYEDGRYVLRDLRSLHGTYLNGEKLEPSEDYPLKDQDVIKLGEVIAFTFSLEDRDVTDPGMTDVILTDGVSINVFTHAVHVRQEILDPPLRPQPFTLLKLLYDNGGKTVTRDRIANTLWPDDAIEGIGDARIDGVVAQLRKRLKDADAEHVYVKTIHGVGYTFIQRP